MKNNLSHADLEARKAALQAKLEVIEAQFRQDLDDLREDLNPGKQIMNLVKRMFAPAPVLQIAKSGAANFALNTGVNMVGRMLLPGWKWKVARHVVPAVAPDLGHTLETAAESARKGLIKALEWVADKTDGDPDIVTPKPKQLAAHAGFQSIF
ncbi:MAG TPA: hypothetical protein PK971_12030 [Saprospiraceae bacterium]|nr:hypothetical protein [Saprospiraceae bacterium]